MCSESVFDMCMYMYFIILIQSCIRVFMYMYIEDCMQMSSLVPGLSPHAIIRLCDYLTFDSLKIA